MQKSSGAQLKWYRARLFVRQTIGLGGEQEAVEPDENQFAGRLDRRRVVVTAGNFAVSDLFDGNRYAHDPRTNFLNWSLSTSGAYDFAADSRGYSWGVVVEWFADDWTLRAGRFLQPKESNGLPLDSRIFVHYGDQVEVQHAIGLGERAGKLGVLVFRNVAIMGRYRDALALAGEPGGTPDLTQVRRLNSKWGIAASLEQELTRELAAFGRASWNNGQTETYSSAEIDRSIAAGLVLKGGRWNRHDDEVAIAVVRNGISTAHRDYLAAGGLGFFLGDGRLAYGPEQAVEAYYEFAAGRAIAIGLDAQRIRNPAYNRDRGPASFYGIRLHGEF